MGLIGGNVERRFGGVETEGAVWEDMMLALEDVLMSVLMEGMLVLATWDLIGLR